MTDVHTRAQRSYNMSRIKSSKTKPELSIKKLMKRLGFSYQPKGIYGRPDYASKSYNIALFIDGCFWHKCPKHYRAPKSNRLYWLPKIARNVKRDRKVNCILRKKGWKVIRIWEHDLK
ncbi:MAG: very short patch repair endonuclease [Nanoarchaeota archaeon]|nr:very short patch repair endonuclease [Nanoarchaeota archaeon]MBU4123880.1 very short patch repair endonuclease [Nanoarchaeota archaeon]